MDEQRPTFQVDERPAVRDLPLTERGYVADFRCPFCGSDTVKISDDDIALDTTRVELYCDNGHCDVQEFVIMGIRGGGRLHRRADVAALRAIDDGTREEQEADGYEFETLADGAEYRVSSFSRWGERSPGERDNATVDRRLRDTHVTVTPTPDDPEEEKA